MPMRAGATRLSRNGSADHSYKISCYQADKEQLPLSAKAYLPGGTWLEPDIGLWVIFGRILNQPLERHELPRLFGDLVHKWGEPVSTQPGRQTTDLTILKRMPRGVSAVSRRWNTQCQGNARSWRDGSVQNDSLERRLTAGIKSGPV
jgi:hypothetical protein